MTGAGTVCKVRGGDGLRQAYRSGYRPLVLACAVLALAGCHRPGASPAGVGGAPDAPAATLNGDAILISDVKREAVSQGLIGAGEPLDPSSDLFHQVLDELVDQKLLADEAVRRRLDKDPQVQRRLAAARERVLGDHLVETEVAQVVNDQAVQTLYAEQLKRSKQGQELHARQIVVRTASDGEAVKKLLASGASFEMLAMDRSIDPNTRFNGGDLGYFTLDVMPPAYGQVLSDAKVGEVLGPFPVEGGFALVKVEDRRLQPPITLEQARPQIVRFLTYGQVRDTLERLRAKAKVKVLVARKEASAPVGSGRSGPVPPGAAPTAPAAAGQAPAPAPAAQPGASSAFPLPGALSPPGRTRP